MSLVHPPSALRAILFADAEQYSRHVHANEQATLDFMEGCFAVLRDLAPQHAGAMLKTTGDGAIVEFDSATEAVLYAIAAQERLSALAEEQPKQQQIRFRVGIHLGEVKHRDGDVFGHIVNIASRLQNLAEPGGICISQAVFEQVRQQVPANFGSLGRRILKNIPQPVIAYRVYRSNGAPIEPQEGLAGQISVSLIERLSLSDQEGNELALKSMKAQALVGYLILTQHNREAKDRILGLLWSNHDLAHAKQEYRSVVRQVKLAFQKAGSNAFDAGPNQVRMLLSSLQVDLLTVSQQLEQGFVTPDLLEGRISSDRILAGLEQADQVFESWLQVTRHRWRDRLIEQLEACLERPSVSNLSNKHAAIALLAIDATHEPAARSLMKVYAADGKTAAAIRVYQSLREVLARDFSIEPSPETHETIQLIRAGHPLPIADAGRDVVDVAPIEGRLPVIAIRPFTRPAGAKGKEHLLAGFRAEVISCLIKFRDWVVIEEAEDQSAPDSGSTAAIDYRLETSMLEVDAGDTVRLALVDAANDRVVWSELFPIRLQEWAAMSGSIARKTAAVVDIYLSAERVAGHPGRRDVSLAAYDDWLRGENLLTLWQPDAEIEAERLFLSVIQQMPRFAPAYASLASIYNVRHIVVAGFKRDPTLERQALGLAQRAVQIDPLETRAHLTLAWSYLMAQRYEQASIHYDLAFDLNANNPKTLLSCAHGFAFIGNAERAQDLARLALSLSPIITPYQWEYLTGIRFILGDCSGAVAAANMGAESMHDTLVWKAAALGCKGDLTEARKAAQEFLAGARAQWTGEPPDDARIVAWILDAFPIKQSETRGRLSEGLRLAGLPVP